MSFFLIFVFDIAILKNKNIKRDIAAEENIMNNGNTLTSPKKSYLVISYKTVVYSL
ncbi:hypothetical protein BPA_0079100 [Borrelia parkeri SLO]|uniref:Uncharacterized protein n=1 Tax=Borrelia parkeri SLO TaxID=1313294 RepID=A0ABN4CCU1_BORPR|nr:hypothetical protein BPA_0079100 [Borrelia parkeri SLO]